MSDKPAFPSEGFQAHRNDLRAFMGVEAWVFDLDNTLYPVEADLFSQINDLIADYVSRLLKIDKSEAAVQQKEYYHTYGTTLRGLMIEHEIDPDDFLRFVHNIDYSSLKPDPELGAAIRALPGRKFIFTNGDRPHAERTAAALGISDHFDDIFDIVAADLMPKPNRETYEMFLKRTGVVPARAAMFEDLQKNLKVPHALGMRTVLIVPQGSRDVFSGEWDLEQDIAPEIDFTTENLAGFLNAVRGAIA